MPVRPLEQAVTRFHTFVPIAFTRAGEGPPEAETPDLDDRGFAGPEPGASVGVTEDTEVQVGVRRQALQETPEARLYATSSDPSVAAVVAPRRGPLEGNPAPVGIRGVRGGDGIEPRKAKIEIRWGGPLGPILGRLTVHVFKPLSLWVALHPVTIKAGIGQAATVAPLEEIVGLLQAIWRPSGIVLRTGAPRPEEAVFSRAGSVNDGPFHTSQGLKNTELDKLLSTNTIPRSINVYFVPKIESGASILGLPPRPARTLGLSHPGIVVADAGTAVKERDAYSWANDVCHEIGHFLGLSHPERQAPPNEREDGWSRRMLMQPLNPLTSREPWPRTHAGGQPFAERPVSDDAGCGELKRGSLLTIKRVAPLSSDGECRRARVALLRGEFA